MTGGGVHEVVGVGGKRKKDNRQSKRFSRQEINFLVRKLGASNAKKNDGRNKRPRQSGMNT